MEIKQISFLSFYFILFYIVWMENQLFSKWIDSKQRCFDM